MGGTSCTLGARGACVFRAAFWKLAVGLGVGLGVGLVVGLGVGLGVGLEEAGVGVSEGCREALEVECG